jgi:hypothetical protein
LTNIIDSCVSPNRCTAGAQNEKCGTFSDTVMVREAVTTRVLFHVRFGEQLCWVPGKSWTRDVPSTKFQTDLTNTLATYPWQTSIKQNVTPTLNGTQMSLYAQWDMAECPIFIGSTCAFHFFPWIRDHWVIPATKAYPPTYAYSESGM